MVGYTSLDEILERMTKDCRICGERMVIVRIYVKKRDGDTLHLEPLLKCLKCNRYDRGYTVRVSERKWGSALRKFLGDIIRGL